VIPGWPSGIWLGVLLALVCIGCAPGCQAQPAGRAALILERQIPLPNVAGRIDHLALDPEGRRLYVAELENGTVDAVDLAAGHPPVRIGGLKKPQGVGALPARREIVVASGGDGSVRFYRAGDLAPVGVIGLGDDADNVRVDEASDQIAIGYGAGALAIIDPAAGKVVRTIALPAHPEAFQLAGGKAFINVPNAGRIAVVDIERGTTLAKWKNPQALFNFPMALDRASGTVAVAYRAPARLVLFRAADGKVLQRTPTCGDADDVWFDVRRGRLYVVCGEGAVDVFARAPGGYAHTARIDTRRGARTGLFSPELDRLYVAVRSGPQGPAAIWVYRPQ
jgi:hypothetical protein